MNIILKFCTTISIVVLSKIVEAYELRPRFQNDIEQIGFSQAPPLTNLPLLQYPSVLAKCFVNNLPKECLVPITTSYMDRLGNINKSLKMIARDRFDSFSEVNRAAALDRALPTRKIMDQSSNINMLPLLHGKLDETTSPNYISSTNYLKINKKLDRLFTQFQTTESANAQERITSRMSQEPVSTASMYSSSSTDITTEKPLLFQRFSESLDYFSQKFFAVTFNKLSSIAMVSRRENGMSYVQSGMFLYLTLLALSIEVDHVTRLEVDRCLGLDASDQERVDLIKKSINSLPASDDKLKFRWSSRLVLNSQTVSEQFRTNVAPVLRLNIDKFNGTETSLDMAEVLNHMVEMDSGGAIHDTFEETDFSNGVRAILITTLYLRARWRSAPTLLNGSRPFFDSINVPRRTVRMIRINDVMRYADLVEWDAEALEIFYSTPGLSLLMLVPRGNSLRRLVEQSVRTGLCNITKRMQSMRMAATLPLYTLRMTLLLPNKLEAINLSSIVETAGSSPGQHVKSFRVSHAVQRIMFWAEAGRNAFKDDGLEWDEAPQQHITVDRPYLFFVRWKNNTLMNGNFVL